jgi:PAS domain-containing protein
MQRFSTLQRRVASENLDQPKLLSRALKELETALEELRVAQEQLVENRTRMARLQEEVTTHYQKYWQLLDEMPQPYVVTKPDSTISEANRAAAELFNVSQRFLVGKMLSVFVCEDRHRFLTTSAAIANDSTVAELAFRLRPRERAPLDVVAKVSGDGNILRWILRPASQPALQSQ